MTDRPKAGIQHADKFPSVVVRLLKGVVYRADDENLWSALVGTQARVRDYVKVLNLQLEVDDAEGFAYLKLREDSDPEAGGKVPQLISRHPLSYPVSLLLALLRKKLVEFDAGGSDTRMVLTRDEIVDLMRVFLPDTNNEQRLRRQVVGYVNRIRKLGFMRRMSVANSKAQPRYEVRRIIMKFVNAQWLADFETKLASHIESNVKSGEE